LSEPGFIRFNRFSGFFKKKAFGGTAEIRDNLPVAAEKTKELNLKPYYYSNHSPS
jgi:hypothetical protein